MLRPTKYSHPDRTVISLALILLVKLKDVRIEDYEKLHSYSRKKMGGDAFFLPALNFLFLLGLIDYRPKTDAIEYIGSHKDETI